MRLDHLLSKEEEVRDWLYCSAVKAGKFLVAMRLGVTPVPIPNTMVKTQAADGTMLGTAWKSRRLPENLKKKRRAAGQVNGRPGYSISCFKAQIGNRLLFKEKDASRPEEMRQAARKSLFIIEHVPRKRCKPTSARECC